MGQQRLSGGMTGKAGIASLATFLCLTILVSVSPIPSVAEDVVILPLPKSEFDRRYRFDRRLIDMAMEKTLASHGPFKVQMAQAVMSKPRIQSRLLAGEEVNVWRASADVNLEQRFLPIRIPILKGLLGYRISIIRSIDQEKFSRITSLEQLRALSVGHGQTWADTKILQNAGFFVVSGQNYEGLFGMLALSRFDHFPRGVNEIVNEVNDRQEIYPSLAIEQDLAMHYIYSSYFYVSPSRPRLKDRLEAGLWGLVEDGSHDKLIQEFFGDDIKRLNLADRKIFEVKNTTLPATVPIDDSRLWFDPLKD